MKKFLNSFIRVDEKGGKGGKGGKKEQDKTSTKPTTTKDPLIVRNHHGYAYSDGDINFLNTARNERDGFGYWKYQVNGVMIDSTILVKKDHSHELFRNDEGHIIVEMPACDCTGDSSPISLHLEKAIQQLESFETNNPVVQIYPVKILFPYKLESWHWNCGEIIINKTGDNYEIDGRAYDSCGKGELEEKIRQQIKDYFEASLLSSGRNIQRITLDHKTNVKSVQTGVYCGGYAARAMHNLKTKGENNIWDEILVGTDSRKSDEDLRKEDCELINLRNPGNANYAFRRESATTFDLAKITEEKRDINKEYEKLKTIIRKHGYGYQEIIGPIYRMAFLEDIDNRGVIYDAIFNEVKNNKDYRGFLFPNSNENSRGDGINPHLGGVCEKFILDSEVVSPFNTNSATQSKNKKPSAAPKASQDQPLTVAEKLAVAQIANEILREGSKKPDQINPSQISIALKDVKNTQSQKDLNKKANALFALLKPGGLSDKFFNGGSAYENLTIDPRFLNPIAVELERLSKATTVQDDAEGTEKFDILQNYHDELKKILELKNSANAAEQDLKVKALKEFALGVFSSERTAEVSADINQFEVDLRGEIESKKQDTFNALKEINPDQLSSLQIEELSLRDIEIELGKALEAFSNPKLINPVPTNLETFDHKQVVNDVKKQLESGRVARMYEGRQEKGTTSKAGWYSYRDFKNRTLSPTSADDTIILFGGNYGHLITPGQGGGGQAYVAGPCSKPDSDSSFAFPITTVYEFRDERDLQYPNAKISNWDNSSDPKLDAKTLMEAELKILELAIQEGANVVIPTNNAGEPSNPGKLSDSEVFEKVAKNIAEARKLIKTTLIEKSHKIKSGDGTEAVHKLRQIVRDRAAFFKNNFTSESLKNFCTVVETAKNLDELGSRLQGLKPNQSIIQTSQYPQSDTTEDLKGFDEPTQEDWDSEESQIGFTPTKENNERANLALQNAFARLYPNDSSATKATPEQRDLLRDQLVKEVLPDWLSRNLKDDESPDGSELLNHLLERITPEGGEKNRDNDNRLVFYEFGPAGSSDLVFSFDDYELQPSGEEITTPSGELISKKIKQRMTSSEFGDVNLGLDGKFEASAALVYLKDEKGERYVTYVKEAKGENEIIWACYDGSNRSEIEFGEYLPFSSACAVAVKYSPLSESKPDLLGPQRYKTKLPEAQDPATEADAIWKNSENAVFTFALSLVSLQNTSQALVKEEFVDVGEKLDQSTIDLQLKGNIRSILDLDGRSGNFIETLEFLEKLTKEQQKELDQGLKDFEAISIQTLLQKKAHEYLWNSAHALFGGRGQSNKIEEVLGLYGFFSNKENLETTLSIVSGINDDLSAFQANPKEFCANLIPGPEDLETKKKKLESKKPQFVTAFDVVDNNHDNLDLLKEIKKYHELYPTAIPQDVIDYAQEFLDKNVKMRSMKIQSEGLVTVNDDQTVSVKVRDRKKNIQIEVDGSTTIPTKDLTINISENELLNFVAADPTKNKKASVEIGESDFKRVAMEYYFDKKGEKGSGAKLDDEGRKNNVKNLVETLTIMRAQPNVFFTPTSASALTKGTVKTK